MAAKHPAPCPGCGKRRFRNRRHALKGLDAARQNYRRLGHAPATWPVQAYRSLQHSRWWHLTSDRRAAEELLRGNLRRLQALLDQTPPPTRDGGNTPPPFPTPRKANPCETSTPLLSLPTAAR